MSPDVFIFGGAIVIVGLLILVSISLTKKRGHTFDKEDYQVDFLRIENSLDRSNEASYAMAIVEGDKLLDRALCEMDYIIPESQLTGNRINHKMCTGTWLFGVIQP